MSRRKRRSLVCIDRGLLTWLCLVGILVFSFSLYDALHRMSPAPSGSELQVPEADPSAVAASEAPAQPELEVSEPEPDPEPGVLALPTPVETAAVQLPPTAPLPAIGAVALVIDDCGNNLEGDLGFLKLDYPLSVAVLPHLPYSRQVAEIAAAEGKCVLLHLPMEARDGKNPGPGALKVAMSDQELLETLRSDLDAVPHLQGMNNHQGSLATADRRVMDLVLEEAAHRNLFFLDSRTTQGTLAPEMARKHRVPLLSRKVFIDNTDDLDSILDQLQQVSQLSEAGQPVVAIGHPRPNTLAALRRWIPDATAQGVELVPLTGMLHHPTTQIHKERT